MNIQSYCFCFIFRLFSRLCTINMYYSFKKIIIFYDKIHFCFGLKKKELWWVMGGHPPALSSYSEVIACCQKVPSQVQTLFPLQGPQLLRKNHPRSFPTPAPHPFPWSLIETWWQLRLACSRQPPTPTTAFLTKFPSGCTPWGADAPECEPLSP